MTHSQVHTLQLAAIIHADSCSDYGLVAHSEFIFVPAAYACIPAVQQLEIEVHKLAGSDDYPLWRL